MKYSKKNISKLVQQALAKRAAFAQKFSSYRIFHHRHDGIPGLIIDQYGTHLVMSSQNVLIDDHLATLAEILQELCPHSSSLSLKNHTKQRAALELPLEQSVLWGHSEPSISIQEPWGTADYLLETATELFPLWQRPLRQWLSTCQPPSLTINPREQKQSYSETCDNLRAQPTDSIATLTLILPQISWTSQNLTAWGHIFQHTLRVLKPQAHLLLETWQGKQALSHLKLITKKAKVELKLCKSASEDLDFSGSGRDYWIFKLVKA